MKIVDLYEAVTKSIIADLEKGVAPWTKPWKTGGTVGALPTNAATGRGYHGINIPILWGATFAKGYPTHGWMTFKQAQGLGAMVRTGEKSTHVVFTKQLAFKEGDSEEQKKIGMLKAYSVFNLAQIEGLPEQQLELPQLSEQQRQDNVETFVRATRADIRIGGDRACYVPALDFIALPPLSSFKAPCSYYATALHELGHNAECRFMPHRQRIHRCMLRNSGDHSA